ncbi:MAG: hypothetical protein OES79_06485 [Planctomycetota bacterium]|nr:hypothetical protein [Planctomycetota bacterium]
MNALANPKVGKFLNENFVSAFQKVGTFRIVGRQKQGGNVASYFCAPDGRVLHVVAGPVDAGTLLKEATWVVDTVKQALKERENNGKSFKSVYRTYHATRLRKEHGLTVEPVAFDAPVPGARSALSYRDPTGKPLAPVLPPPPIEGPDVSFTPEEEAAFNARQDVARKAAGAQLIADRRGRRWALNNQGRVHMLMAAHSMKKIETVYGTIFENILGERVSTQPVIVNNPFPWVRDVSEIRQRNKG